jgi:hypothetical protein
VELVPLREHEGLPLLEVGIVGLKPPGVSSSKLRGKLWGGADASTSAIIDSHGAYYEDGSRDVCGPAGLGSCGVYDWTTEMWETDTCLSEVHLTPARQHEVAPRGMVTLRQ